MYLLVVEVGFVCIGDPVHVLKVKHVIIAIPLQERHTCHYMYEYL